ncbi:MAG: response regulator [Chitinophagaceae bacterium]|nr:response regulator [Chitinophagaceae bacterium]
MERFNAIVIDDETSIRHNIVNLIRNHCPQIDVVGSAGNAEEGRRLIKKYSVDFIFLDIMMPNEDGFQFLETIKKDDYGLIFITAYNEHAFGH